MTVEKSEVRDTQLVVRLQPIERSPQRVLKPGQARDHWVAHRNIDHHVGREDICQGLKVFAVDGERVERDRLVNKFYLARVPKRTLKVKGDGRVHVGQFLWLDESRRSGLWLVLEPSMTRTHVACGQVCITIRLRHAKWKANCPKEEEGEGDGNSGDIHDDWTVMDD